MRGAAATAELLRRTTPRSSFRDRAGLRLDHWTDWPIRPILIGVVGVRRYRRLLDGTGPFSGLGLLCWLAGLAMLTSILMSPEGWQWWMDVHSTTGHEVGGLVYYRAGGAAYTVDDPSAGAGPSTPPRTLPVYFLASDPGGGSLHNVPTQILDWSTTAGPGAAGLLLIVVGFARRLRHRRAGPPAADGGYGTGIPPHVIDALRANRQPTAR